jgi:putative transposase
MPYSSESEGTTAHANPNLGGRRPGAGRKPAPGRRAVMHRSRAAHDPRFPVHVTLRACAGLPSLRAAAVFVAIRHSFGATSSETFRLLHFSVQGDHLHLLVEADGCSGLRRGVQGLPIRVAKAINRVLRGRGRVWGDRYHARALATPREVRHALVYVLANWRKHVPGARGLDPRSSAAWFTGWRSVVASLAGGAPVVGARTWLGRVGWRRHGLVDVDEGPRCSRRGRRRVSPGASLP